MQEKQHTFSLTGKKHKYNTLSSILAFIRQAGSNQKTRTALVDSEEKFDYQTLLYFITSVAEQLKELKISKGSRIAILAQPSCRLVILILATLENRASYIPIDPSYPKDRIQYILNDSQPDYLVTDSKSEPLLDENELQYRLLNLQEINFTLSPEKKVLKELNTPPNDSSLGNDPAYIIYTSGTTGKPKGIVISHRSISNHMVWMTEEFKLTAEDVFLLKTPLTFDPSVWEIFLPLFLGATLVIGPTGVHKNPSKLVDIINQHKVSILQLVPSILHGFLRFSTLENSNPLRYVFVGGESLPPSTKKLFSERMPCPLVNLYGPAEATIDSTFHIVEKDAQKHEKNYIGKPIYNSTLYVLNSNLKPVKENEVGELFIAGDGLAMGYLNRPELNKERFIKNPFSSKKEDKLYKTGDLVKIDQGKLEFIGRVDHQIKINGVRIETKALRDIILKTNANIYECLFEKEVHELYQNSRLVCFILKKEGDINLDIIKSKLKEQFPAYMLPQKYYVSSFSELSDNGKVDLKKIKKQLELKKEKRSSEIESTKSKLFEIWEHVLGDTIPNEKSDFYDLGGDSITSHILSYEISNQFSIDFKPLSMINFNTIEKQVKLLSHPERLVSSELDDIVPMNSKAPIKLFLIHPIGGTTFWYTHLAKLLDEKVQIYGIQDPALADKNKTFKNLQEMASHYASLILKKQENGPFWLGGASFGGTVAIEIARCLKHLQHEIRQVLLLDSWAVYPKELKDIDYFKSSMRRQQKDWVNKFNQSHTQIDFFDDVFSVQLQRLDMLFKYKQTHVPFDMKLFKAQELMPIFQMGNSSSNYWEDYTKNLQVSLIPGNHETMFLSPNIETLANEIEKAAPL